MHRRKRITWLILAAVLSAFMVQPASADNCVATWSETRCVWDWGCWATYPITPPGQYWTYDYCKHADGTTHVINKYESGGCCTP